MNRIFRDYMKYLAITCFAIVFYFIKTKVGTFSVMDSVLIFIVTLIAIIFVSEAILELVSRISIALSISEFVIGVLIVTTISSLPEIISNVMGTVAGDDVASVSAMFTNMIFQTLVIIGFVSIIRCSKKRCITFHDSKSTVLRDGSFMIIGTTLLTIFSFTGGAIVPYEGLILIAGYIVYVLIILVKSDTKDVSGEIDPSEYRTIKSKGGYVVMGVVFFIALIVLALASDLMMTASFRIGNEYGLSEAKVGALLIGMLTSTPELVFTLLAMLKGNKNIAVGSLIGVTIFDSFVSMGLPAVIDPIVMNGLISGIILVFFTISFLMSVVFMRTNWELEKWEGIALIFIFIFYISLYIIPM